MKMTKIALGSRAEATQCDCLKALVVEFITTFLFVFAGVLILDLPWLPVLELEFMPQLYVFLIFVDN